MGTSIVASVRISWRIFRTIMLVVGCLGLVQIMVLCGQEITGTIVGRLSSQETLPEQTLIRLFSMGDVPAGELYTDSHGNFSFTAIPPGTYYVTVEVPGYKPVRLTVNLQYPSSNPRARVNIDLEPLARETGTTGQIISGSKKSHELNANSLAKPFSKKSVREFEKGREEAEKGNFAAAEKHFQNAVESDPDFYPALNNLGALYLRQGQNAKAEDAFHRAIQLNQEDSQGYINMGHLLFEEGRFREAISQLEQGLKRSPNSALGRFFLGSAYFKVNSLEKAELNLRQACQLDASGMPQVHLQLANVYLRLGNDQSAAVELEEFLKLSPSDPRVPTIRNLLIKLKSN